MSEKEYSTAEVRNLMLEIFPHRKLVLSQFTFFQQVGVITPTGCTQKRGRKCFRLTDLLSLVAVLELKERGIALKGIEQVPSMIRNQIEEVFKLDTTWRLSGYKGHCSLKNEDQTDDALNAFLSDNNSCGKLFWSIDLSMLASKLLEVRDLQDLRDLKTAYAA